MKIENLNLQSQIDNLDSNLDTQVNSLSSRITSNTNNISSCNTKINTLTTNMKYYAALKLYSSQSNKSSYTLSNSLVSDINMYDFLVAKWVIYNGSNVTTRRGAVVIPVEDNDTFCIEATWLAGVNSIWQAKAQFYINFAGKTIYRQIEYDENSGTPQFHIVLTDIWGFADTELITS